VVCLAALGACTTTSSEASNGSGDEVSEATVEVPIPTIGLGSGDLFAPSAPEPAADPGAVESIVMIGDSITVASTPELERQLDELGFDDVTIVAQQGKRIEESFGDNTGGALVADYLADEFAGGDDERLWIVALGTNDIGQYSDPSEVSAAVASVVDEVPDDAPLIWVDTYIEDRPDDTAAVNAAIAQAVTRRGNAAVGPWSAYASIDGVLSDDGVHPNDEGEIAFASVVTSTVAGFLER
jgi:lysophospholipase L1-like esterase